MRTTHHDTNRRIRRRRRAAASVALATTLLTAMSLLPAAADARRARASWAPDLDRKIVPTRVERLGPQLATWYGPGFFGNRTACGRKLTQRTFGIAHRTLPCGTLVHLDYRGRQINVRVIDRGPYSGAKIDLTSRTKYFLRFTSGTVKVSKVKRYRAIPKRPQRFVGTFSSS